MKKIYLLAALAFASVSNAQWVENFDDSTELPNGWAIINDGDDNGFKIGEPDYGGQYAQTPTNVALIEYSYYAHDDFLITKEINVVDKVSTRLSFWVQSTNFDLERYEVLLSTTDQSKEAFTTVLQESQNAPTLWTKNEIDLSEYEGQTVYVAIHAISPNKRALYVDSFTVDAPPTCLPPTSVTSTDITSSTANISWTASTSNPGTGYQIFYTKDATAISNDPVVNETNSITVDSNATSATLENLKPNTFYYVYVRALCSDDDTSTWSTSTTFRTQCSYEILDYGQSFDEMSADVDCWVQAFGGDASTGYETTGSSRWTGKEFLNNTDNSKAAQLNLYSDYRKEWLISPKINMTGANNPELSFDYGITKWSSPEGSEMGSDDYVQVLVSTDDGQSWTVLQTWNNSNTPDNTSNHYSVDLSNYISENTRIAFFGTDGSTNDNIDYSFYIDNFAIKNGTTTPPASAQWVENFDDSTELPEGWAIINNGDDNGFKIGEHYYGGQAAHTPSNVAFIEYSATAHDDYLVTKEINVVDGLSTQISFWIQSRNFYLEEYEVLLSTTDQSKEAFTTVLQGVRTAPTAWTKNLFDLSNYIGQTVYLAIHATSVNKLALHVDSFTVDAPPTCIAPKNLTVNNITGNSADISWDTSITTVNNGYEIFYTTDGTALDNNPTLDDSNSIIIDANTTNVSLDNLNPNTFYYVYVRALCADDDTSAWSLPYTFRTLCSYYTLDYEQNFDDMIANVDCWIQGTGGDATTGFETEENSKWTGREFLNNTSNSKAAQLNMFKNEYKEWFISPRLDMTGATNPELSFDYGITEWSSQNASDMGSDDYVQVLVSTDDGQSWTVLQTWNNTNSPDNTSNQFTVSLSDYISENTRIAFYGTDGDVDDDVDYSFYIDNFAIKNGTAPITAQWVENFDDNTELPDGWAIINNGDDNEFKIGEHYYGGQSAHTPNNVAYIEFSSTAHDDYLVTKEINVVDGLSTQISFFVQSRNFYLEEYEVLLSTTDQNKEAFTTVLQGVRTAPTAWTKNLFDLSEYIGQTVYVAIHAISANKLALHVDSFTVDAPPTCIAPKNLTSTNITGDSAEISWDASVTTVNNGYEVFYTTDGTALESNPTLDDTNSIIVDANTTSITLDNLNPNTFYYVYVRALCADDDTSAWSLPYTFQTLCTYDTLDYVQNFDDMIANVDCWVQGTGGDATTGFETEENSKWTGREFLNNTSNSKAAQLNLFKNEYKEWFISPRLDMTGATKPVLRFNYGITEWSSQNASEMGSDDYIQLLVSTDDGQTWTVLQTWNNANSPDNTANQFSVNLSEYISEHTRIAFYGTDGEVDDDTDYSFYIDDFSIVESLAVDSVEFTELKLYPNPAKDVVYLENNSPIVSVALYSVEGKEVLVKNVNKEKVTLDISNLPIGVYFIKINTNDGVKYERLLKK